MIVKPAFSDFYRQAPKKKNHPKPENHDSKQTKLIRRHFFTPLTLSVPLEEDLYSFIGIKPPKLKFYTLGIHFRQFILLQLLL